MALHPDDLSAARTAIQQAERILIMPHANVDPDGISSALSCYSIFKALGKDCTVICPDSPPESLKFMPNYGELTQTISESQNFIITLDCSSGVEVDKLRYDIEDQKVNIIVIPKKGKLKKSDVQILEGMPSYDLIVIVDTAELPLLGSLYKDHIDLFSDVPILNIDHHISNTQFGQLKLIDPTAASATQVLYQLFLSDETWKRLLTPDIATLLLTGLITDTRSFQNPNTTPRSLEIAAELLDLGARQQEIIQHVYKTKPLSTLKIWGRALNRIQIDPDSRIVWSAISTEDMREMGAVSKETTGILDEIISTIPNADVYILFTELEDGGLKASLRSSPAIDVSRLAAKTFSGGGHARAAGFSVKKFSNFSLAVVECIQKLKETIVQDRKEDEGGMRGQMSAVSGGQKTEGRNQKAEEKKESPPVVLSKEGSIDIVDALRKPSEEKKKKNGNGK